MFERYELKIFFICNRKRCKNCSYPECKHTTDPEFAKHKERVLTPENFNISIVPYTGQVNIDIVEKEDDGK